MFGRRSDDFRGWPGTGSILLQSIRMSIREDSGFYAYRTRRTSITNTPQRTVLKEILLKEKKESAKEKQHFA